MRWKQFLAIIFSVVLLAACSGNEEASEETANAEEDDGIEVEKGLLNVEVTLPSEFFEEDELGNLKNEIKEEHNADVKQNENGSLSIKMSKKDHKKMLKEMRESMEDSVEEIVASEDFTSIHDITYNKGFTEFKVTVDQEVFEESFDSFATLTLGLSGLYYQAFSGKDIEKEKVKIELINEETDEVYDEIIYPDVMDEMETDESE